MTLEQLERYRDAMTPDAFTVASLLAQGMGPKAIGPHLHMGQMRVYALIGAAERAVGVRLRREHGQKTADVEREALRDLAAGARIGPKRVKRQRCGVCRLSLPHECLNGGDYMRRSWDGEMPGLGTGRSFNPGGGK